MAKIVSLTVHKSQRARRHAKGVRDDIRLCVANAQRDFGTDLHGYALVTWNSAGDVLVNWDGVTPLGGCPIESFVGNAVLRARMRRDTLGLIDPDDDGA